MKYGKSIALIYLYDQLIQKKRIEKSRIIRTLEISEIAFWRYIQDIRAFLTEFDPGKELVYNKKNQSYELICNEHEWGE